MDPHAEVLGRRDGAVDVGVKGANEPDRADACVCAQSVDLLAATEGK